MNTKGQEGGMWMIIIGAAIALIVLVVTLMPILRGSTTFGELFSGFEYGNDFKRCTVNFRTGMPDVDKDGCADSADFCSFTSGEIDKLPAQYREQAGQDSEASLAIRGNNYCDRDSDGVPDICDRDPMNAKLGCVKGFLGVANRCEPTTSKVPIDFTDKSCIGPIQANRK